MDDAAPATTVRAVVQGEPVTAHHLRRSQAMRTARYLSCLSLLTAAVLAPPPAAGAADTSQKVVATIPVCFHPIGVAVRSTLAGSGATTCR